MICTNIDNWLRNYMEQTVIWIVQLDDGTTVYQDDDRPGMEDEPPAWLRLKEHVKENDLKIIALKLRFRDNVKHVENNADGYYFARGVRGNAGGYNKYFYSIGVAKKNNVGEYKLFVDKWMTPELIKFNDGETEERGLSEIKGDALIVNKEIQIAQ